MKGSKHLKRIMAFALTFCLIFTMSVPSFAAGGLSGLITKGGPEPTKTYNAKSYGKALNYVAFGDSQSSGYYLDGYFLKNADGTLIRNSKGETVDKRGYNSYVKGTYEDLFAQHLVAISNKQVNLYQYTGNAMRCEDLHKLFDSSAVMDQFYADWFDGSQKFPGDPAGGGVYFRDFYIDTAENDYQGIGSYDRVSKDVKRATKNADVISIALGINSFGNFFTFRTLERLVSDDPSLYGKVDTTKYLKLSKVQKKLYDSLHDTVLKAVRKMVGEEKGALVEKLDAVLCDLIYAYTGFATGFDNCLDDFEKLNPDATVIAIGISNGTSGLVLDYNGTEIDLGKLIGIIISAANLYMKSACSKSDMDTIYINPGEFGKIYQTVATLSKEEIDFESATESFVKENVAKAVVDFVQGFSDGAKNSMTVENEDKRVFNEEAVMACVKDYLAGAPGGQEAADFADADEDEGPATLTDEEIAQVYLGIRDAVIDAAKHDGPLDLVNTLTLYAAPESAAPALKAYFESEESQAKDLRTRVYDTMMGGVPGMENALFLNVRIAVNTAGSHTSYDGHASIAKMMSDEYDKFLLRQTVKKAIKISVAVPVVVGGIAVTYVTREVGGNIISAVIAARFIKKAKEVFKDNTDSTLLRTLFIFDII